MHENRFSASFLRGVIFRWPLRHIECRRDARVIVVVKIEEEEFMNGQINAPNPAAKAEPKKSNKTLWIAGCGGCGCLAFLAVVAGLIVLWYKW